jgi:hypothetical protein
MIYELSCVHIILNVYQQQFDFYINPTAMHNYVKKQRMYVLHNIFYIIMLGF